MARTYLFLVHGVGKHDAASWADPWKRVLIDKLRTFAPYSDMTPEEIERDAVCFVTVGYDAVFEGWRTRWKTAADALASNEIVAGTPAHKAVDWLARQGDQGLEGALWEKVLDVLLWATHPLARAQVMFEVNKQLVDGLLAMNAETNGTNTAHVLAHSLGTSVAHDSLVALRADEKLHGGTLGPKVFQWRSLTMLANTSRLLEPRFDVSDDLDPDDFKVYDSAIKPGSNASIVKYYFNIHHALDPIALPRRFEPMTWGGIPFKDQRTLHFDEVERVHDFETYASNPFFHLPFFQLILGNTRLGAPDEVERALKDLKRDYPKTATFEFESLKGLIDPDPNAGIGVRALFEYLTKAFKELSR